MAFETFLKNLKSLEKELALPYPLELDDSLSCTLILGDEKPIALTIRYNINEEKVTLNTLVTLKLPESRLGIQTMMNQLVTDLFSQDKAAGRLIADPELSSVSLNKELSLHDLEDCNLSDITIRFLAHAGQWRAKFKQVLENVSDDKSLKEVVSFEAI